MKLLIVKNYEEMSKKAAEIIINEIQKKPNLVLGFATGKTPRRAYKLLVKAYKKGKIDFSKIKAFSFDEYYPIKKSDKKSFYYYLHKNLFDKVNIEKENINLLNGETKNPAKECRDYETKVRKSDLIILGVGENGHIAFNEPGSSFNSKTRLVKLKHKAVKDRALTIGISTIMSAKKLLLLASGKKKAEAIKCLLNCKPDGCCPVSFLKKHENLIVIVDKGAGNLIG